MIPVRNAVWIFWTAYVVGTLVLIFALLLAQVPRPRHGADLSLDYFWWSLSAVLMLVSLLAGRRLWNRWYPPEDAGFVARTAFCAIWLELVLSLCAIFSLALDR